MSAAPAPRHARLGQPARCGIDASPVTRGRSSAPVTGCSPAARASREISAEPGGAPSSRSGGAERSPQSSPEHFQGAGRIAPVAVEGRPRQREIGVVEDRRRRRDARSTVERDRAPGAAPRGARAPVSCRAPGRRHGRPGRRATRPIPRPRPAARRAPPPGRALRAGPSSRRSRSRRTSRTTVPPSRPRRGPRDRRRSRPRDHRRALRARSAPPGGSLPGPPRGARATAARAPPPPPPPAPAPR